MKRMLIMASLALAGCTTVGPDYLEPAVAVPARFSEASGGPGLGDAELASWWRALGDPQLSRLVASAIAQNLDVAAAGARIREARALERAAGAGAFPRLAAEASVIRQRISENAIPIPPGSGGSGVGFGLPGKEFTTWRVGFDVGWEIDLFGRNVREREAARARTGSAIWARRDIQVSIAAEVASAYLRLRTAQAKVENARAELERQQRSERLVLARARGGLVNSQDVARQSSERGVGAAAIPRLEAQAESEIHALGVLVGLTPEALVAQLAQPVAQPAVPSVPVGLPSDLLRRRPDIREAERELAAATADIGVAVADLYPRFSLTAAPALVSTALASFLKWGSRSFTIGGAIDWPLFDGGRRRATVEARTARQEYALLAYRKSVLSALRDVEDALSRIEGDRGRLERLEEALASAARAEEIARSRYRGGLVTLSEVLQARARMLSLEEQVIDTRGALALDTVSLFKALGGGWQESGQ